MRNSRLGRAWALIIPGIVAARMTIFIALLTSRATLLFLIRPTVVPKRINIAVIAALATASATAPGIVGGVV